MHKALTKEKNNLVFIIHEKKILGVMLLNTTFDNISVISWQSFLLLEETGVSGENHQLATSLWQKKYWNQLTNYNIKTRCSSDCIGRCKSNYNTITAMMDPQKVNIDQVKIQYNRCSGQYQSNLLNFWDTYKP